ncbi:OmpA family protein [Streptacidiphilus carbonis]|uniref:OmpA family protein n=1 Tax=Streptacidiphilus carbonis TaxID=105422 RepID=UPI0005AB12F0|nr:OmpA family protein [Streptacidiphilus carbonis]
MKTKQAARPRRRIAGTLVAIGLLAVTGCGSSRPAPDPGPGPVGGTAIAGVDSPCPSGAAGAVTLVLGARANSPAPQLDPAVDALLDHAAAAGRPITVIRSDGSPEKVISETFSSRAGNTVALRGDRIQFERNLQTTIDGVRAKSAQADPLTALGLAGRSTQQGGTVVMIDSGLQTVAPLNFRSGGLLDAAPEDVTSFLSRGRDLPALQGLSVVLMGIGDTAAPQPRLPSREHANLVALWKAVAQKAGAACVDVVSDPATGPAVSGVPSVSTVPVPAQASYSAVCGTQVLYDSGSVGFLPDSAVLRDPAAARSVLGRLAGWIADKGFNVALTGTTADWGTEQGRHQLSVARATSVQNLLLRLGVPADRITVTGVGSDWPGYIPDRAPNGALLPGPAEHNRSVLLNVRC